MAGINSTIAPYVTIDSFLDYAKYELNYVNAYLEARAVESPILDADGNKTGETEKVLVVTAYGNGLDKENNLILSDVTGLPVVYNSETIWSSRVLDDAMFELFHNGKRIDDSTLRWGCYRADEDSEPIWAKAPRVYSVTLDGEVIVLNGDKRANRFADADDADDDQLADA